MLTDLKADAAYPVDRCEHSLQAATRASYDEVSFDPEYPSEPMATFDPMVRRVLHKEWTPPS